MMTTANGSYHVEINVQQKRPKGEIALRRRVHVRYFQGRGRTILVLSDGIGHGIKANVLATLDCNDGIEIHPVSYKTGNLLADYHGGAPQSSDGEKIRHFHHHRN